MRETRCPFCHEYVDEVQLAAHQTRHLEQRDDGQHTDYVTLPPESREHGDLIGVPTVYVHNTCGNATGMPEEIVRSYLQNPFLYMADATFCTGCGTHVPNSECVWTETGENLQHYMDALRSQKPELRPNKILQIAAEAVSAKQARNGMIIGVSLIVVGAGITGGVAYSFISKHANLTDFDSIVGTGFFCFVAFLLIKGGVSIVKIVKQGG